MQLGSSLRLQLGQDGSQEPTPGRLVAPGTQEEVAAPVGPSALPRWEFSEMCRHPSATEEEGYLGKTSL